MLKHSLIQETLSLSSIESFLSSEEVNSIIRIIDKIKNSTPLKDLDTLISKKTIHSIEGLAAEKVIDLYSPLGRIEITQLPSSIYDIMLEKFRLNFVSIQRNFPSATKLSNPIYIEYSQGQFINPHADFISNEEQIETLKVGAISISLTDDYVGGEFYIDTCSSNHLWTNSNTKLKDDVTPQADWLSQIKKTRWHVKPSCGDAVLFGSQLIHGTNPISFGIAKKLLAFLTT